MSPNPSGMLAIGIVLPIIGTLAVLARFGVRRSKRTKLGADDWTALVGSVGMWGIAAVILAGTVRGLFGHHTQVNPKTHLGQITWREQRAVEYHWIVLILTIFSLGIVKLSVVLLYRRIFQVSRIFNIYSIVLIVLIVIWCISYLFANIFQCGSRFWAAWTSKKTLTTLCDDINDVTVSFCLTDVIMDLMVLLAPIPMIWKLQMPTKDRIGLLGIFALGFLSTAASVVRAEIMVGDVYNTVVGFRDVLAIDSNIVTWSLVEVTAAIVGACLPTIRPFFSGKSPESLIGSIRSALSLQSLSSRGSARRRQGEDSQALTTENEGTEIKSIRKSESKSNVGSTHTGAASESSHRHGIAEV